MGKTQTALEYVHRKKEHYSSIFWISGVNQATLLTGFQQIATETNCITTTSESKPSETAKQVLSWLQKQTNWLLIIDNLDDISVITGFLPAIECEGHTLITTRNPNSKGIPAQGLEVDSLDPNDAVEVFIILSELDDIPDSCRKKVEEIVKELGYLPLAIEQSAAYIRETSTKPDDFLALYQKNRSTRQQLHKWVPEGNRIYQYSVTTTWQMSFDLIKKDDECPAATQLLQLFAFLNPDVILFDFLEAGSEVFENELRDVINDRVELNKTIRVLQRFSLIKRLRGIEGISIHRLVQQTIQNEMEEDVWHMWWEKIANLCHFTFPTETTDLTMSVCRRYEEQVLVPLSKSPEIYSIPLTMALNRVASFLREDGKYAQSEELHEKDLRICKGLLGERHPDTLTAMANLASTYRNQGRWDEAVALEEKVLEVSKEVLGERHPSTLTAMANLASTYWNQGRWDEAVALEEKVLEVSKEVLGERHPSTLTAMANLASTYRNQGRWDEAVALEEKVLEVRKEVLGERHPDTLTAMANLASTYRNQGRWDEAVALEEKVLEVSKEVLGDRHPSTLTAMANLASTYRNQGRWDEAVVLEEKVLEVSKEVLGDRHPSTLTAMANLASTYWNQGRWDEAVALEEKVLEVRKEVLGDRHPATLTAMANLASTYWNQGRWDEAVVLQEKVLEVRKEVLGDRHPYTLTAMANLASTYRNQGRWDEAVALEEKVLEVSKEVLGDRHPDTLTAMANLASTYRNQGRWDEAVALQEKVLEVSKEVLGDRHPSTLTAMASLVWVKENHPTT